MTKRLLTILVLISLVLATMAGCSSATPTVPGGDATSTPVPTVVDDKPVHLVIMVPELVSDTVIKEGFNKIYPNITYDCIIADYTKLMSMVAADNAPDVWSVGAFHTGIMYTARGLFLNLDEYVAKSELLKKDDFTDIEKLFMWDGQSIGKGSVYGIVKDWSLDTQLWLNKKVFADAGIPLPDTTKPITFTQLAEYATKMVKIEDGKQTRWGFAGGLTMEQLVMFQLGQMGKSLYNADYSTNFNTPEVKAILQYWVDLAKSGGCASALSAPADVVGVSTFMQDQVGIAMWGYWYSAYIKGNEEAKLRLEDFVFVQSPVMDGATNPGNSCIAGVGGAVFSRTDYPDAAWKFVEYYYGGPSADDRAKSGWGIPMLKSKVAMMPYETPFDKQVKDLNDLALTKVLPLTTNPYTNPGAVQAVFDKYFNQVLFDKMTLDECITKMDEDFKVMIDEGKEIVGVK